MFNQPNNATSDQLIMLVSSVKDYLLQNQQCMQQLLQKQKEPNQEDIEN